MKALYHLTTFLVLFPFLLHGQIVTNPDSVEVYLYETNLVDVLINDYEIGSDSIYVDYAPGYQVIANRYIVVNAGDAFQGRRGRVDTVTYHVKQVNGSFTNTGELYITLINESFDELDVNNLSARFYAFGHHFWDFTGSSRFFAPKNSGKSPIFTNTLWVGGMRINAGTLHVAAELYRQSGKDYWAGPVSIQYDSLYDRQWNRIWKLTKADIYHHINSYTLTGYSPIPEIADWPAHGDTLKGQLWQMAPFHDSNSNGIYEPMLGDYPLIRGDMALFFVFNDTRGQHTESGGSPLGIEVHGMAYGFDLPNDPMMNNTIFLHYDIINRSVYSYENTFVGMFNDFDIGYTNDDYIQTHVPHGGVFGFNGTSIDGSGQTWAYGAHPPAMGMQLLAGPFMDSDGLDNPRTDSLNNPLCDVSLNGLNFGDTIVDNERLGLSTSIAFRDGGPAYATAPSTASEYYGYLRATWKDMTKMIYGQNGHPASGGYGPDCNFFFPANSDSCLFGTGGAVPNGPVFWTEQTAGNMPGDRRMIGSTGPFTCIPGATHSIDVAFIFTHDTVANSPVDTLIDWFGKMKDLFANNQVMFNPTLSIRSIHIPVKSTFQLYPNPAVQYIIVKGFHSPKPYPYQLIGIDGRLIEMGNCTNGDTIDISHLKPGLYFIRIETTDGALSRKFVKH